MHPAVAISAVCVSCIVVVAIGVTMANRRLARRFSMAHAPAAAWPVREALDLDGDPVHDDLVRRAAAARAGRTPIAEVLRAARGIHETPEAAAERNRRALEQIHERRAATTAATEEILVENRRPRNIRLRDRHGQ